MNFIEINKILEKGMKIRRKEWIPQGSQASGMIYLYYNGIGYIPQRYMGAQVNYRIHNFLVKEDYLADDWEIVEDLTTGI
jgi:hypothetical protein